MTVANERQTARRTVLRGLVSAGGVAVLGGHASGRAIPPVSSAHRPLLDLAARAEAAQIALYRAVLERATFAVGDHATESLQHALAAEGQHLDLLVSLGAARPTAAGLPSEAVLHDASAFVAAAQGLEAASLGFYLAATHEFAAQGRADLSAASARLAAQEAQHQVLLCGLAGLSVSEASLPHSGAVPGLKAARQALVPYLETA